MSTDDRESPDLQLIQNLQKLMSMEIRNDKDIDLYTRRLKAVGSDLYLRIGMDADFIQARLSQYKGRWFEFGLGAKIRAKLVAAHLRVGAEAFKTGAVGAIKMNAAFRKHFVEPEREAKQAKHRSSKSFTIQGD